MKFYKAFTLIIILTLGMLSCEMIESETVVEGTVFRGPINPVEIVGEINDAPFSADFHIFDSDGKKILTFSSDKNGKYSFEVSPGVYKLVPDSSAPLLGAEYQIKEIAVGIETISALDLYFDTGIR